MCILHCTLYILVSYLKGRTELNGGEGVERNEWRERQNKSLKARWEKERAKTKMPSDLWAL